LTFKILRIYLFISTENPVCNSASDVSNPYNLSVYLNWKYVHKKIMSAT